MISEFEKHIYNSHLKATRQQKKAPFSIRKDFSSLDDTTILALKKLSHFFNKHKEIIPFNYFNASYKIYTDETFLDLNFFNTLKAIKAYTVYNNTISKQEPDSPEQIDFTKQSLHFIYTFCKNKSIDLKHYADHKDNNIFSFLKHLKNRQVNLYCLFGIFNFEDNLKKSDSEIVRFMLSEVFLDQINMHKIKFFNSKKCKTLVTKGLQIIEEKLKKELISR